MNQLSDGSSGRPRERREQVSACGSRERVCASEASGDGVPTSMKRVVPERQGAKASGVGAWIHRQPRERSEPLEVMREGHGPSASGVGVGPHAIKKKLAALLAFVGLVSVSLTAQQPFARDPKIAIDEEYSKKIKEYTTQPFFTSPLVDYLP